ncbi:MAG: YqiA/YcfP family alpha/beta fold hydrolase [Motiliproteus sp.]
MTKPLYLYIHGFNSSPHSYKARQLLLWLNSQELDGQIVVPKLPYQPGVAISLLETLIDKQIKQQPDQPLVLLGSSLGGFYATWLTEKFAAVHDIRTVLINPSVRPFDLLEVWLGDNENIYTHEKYQLNRDHLAQLKALHCSTLSDASRYLLLTQTDDEVLDYRQAVEMYAASPQWVIKGGDHGFQQFERCWPRIFDFAGDRHLQQLAQCALDDGSLAKMMAVL